jgi:hypothetical protein
MKMNLNDLTLSQIITLKNNLCKNEAVSSLRIVVLDRGWVYIGYLNEEDSILEKASCIRRWGTSKGLGELALEGKKENTVLEKCGTVIFNKKSEIHNIVCDVSKWSNYYE